MELKYNWQDLEDGTAQIDIFQPIDDLWGYSLAALNNQLTEAKGKPLLVRVNSPGGYVLEALAISSLINGYSGGVKVGVLGYAASSASIIVTKAEEAIMSADSFFMIHEPAGGIYGTASEQKRAAETTQKFEDKIVNIYLDAMERRGKRKANSEEVIRAAMKNETWYTAQEALDMGFIDKISDSVPTTLTPLQKQNMYNGQVWNVVSNFKNAPDSIKNKFDNINQEDTMTKSTFFEKIKNLINGVEDTEDVNASASTTEPTAVEMTVETAQAFLAENGFTVTPNEEVFTAEDMAVEFENAVNIRVEAKLKAMEADKKKGAFTAAQAKKDDTKPTTSPFDSVSGFLKGRK